MLSFNTSITKIYSFARISLSVKSNKISLPAKGWFASNITTSSVIDLITAGFPFINVTVPPSCNPPFSAHTSLNRSISGCSCGTRNSKFGSYSPPDASISLVSFTVIFLTALSNALNKGFPTTSAAPTSNVTGSASSSSCKICPSLVRKLNVISTISPSFGNASLLESSSVFFFPLLILISVVNPSWPLRTSCKIDPENASGPASFSCLSSSSELEACS
mmetsp:Transcript_3618/g.12121  ORF Transcript_3618/g.12121 Transcript_3618/m.12121 type:complete len:219 (-) Transcript_3618:165-821(-)